MISSAFSAPTAAATSSLAAVSAALAVAPLPYEELGLPQCSVMERATAADTEGAGGVVAL